MRALTILLLVLLVLASCKTRQKMTDAEVLEKGAAISGKLLTALLSELTNEMKENGVAGAINYCSLEALPITRQISEAEQLELGRVSHRFRNPLNAASDEELKLIENYVNLQQAGARLSPVIIAGKGMKTFYSPILLAAPLCLSCHGKSEEIDPGVLAVIKEKYPNDRAVNFELNEVRGMFKVVFRE
jgi:hypothetical protein